MAIIQFKEVIIIKIKCFEMAIIDFVFNSKNLLQWEAIVNLNFQKLAINFDYSLNLTNFKNLLVKLESIKIITLDFFANFDYCGVQKIYLKLKIINLEFVNLTNDFQYLIIVKMNFLEILHFSLFFYLTFFFPSN